MSTRKPRPGRPRAAPSGARDARTRISVYLTPELHARVLALAWQERRTISTVAMHAIVRGLSDHTTETKGDCHDR